MLPASLTSEDGTSVRCDGVPTSHTSPGGEALPGPYTASLAFSYDLQELLWAQRLDYYPAAELLGVEPATVSQGRSELVLSVAAAGLVDGGEEARCRLEALDGGLAGKSYIASRVLYQSSSRVECTFGAIPNGGYAVTLASNGAQYVAARTPIRVLPAVQILGADPPLVLRHMPG